MNIDELPGQADAHARTEARAEARRHQRIAVAHRGGWPELPRRHLRFDRFSIVVDERDETIYRDPPRRGRPGSPAVVAYFIDEHGDPVFLEERPSR